MLKRRSCLASNEAFRVRILAGVLLVPWSNGKTSPRHGENRWFDSTRDYDGWATRLATGLAWKASEPIRPCGFNSHPFRCVCGVMACMRGCEPRGAGFKSRQSCEILVPSFELGTICSLRFSSQLAARRKAGFQLGTWNWVLGVCSWESKLPPKQPHRVRILALLLTAGVARHRKAPHP